MATIRAYTTIEQSRKLAEILRLESADICHVCGNTTLVSPTKYGDTSIEELYKKHIIPAWSLAALLSVLPRVDMEKEIRSDDTYDYRVKAYIGDGYIGDWYNDPIDACVEMIERLHKLNLL